MKSIVDQNLPGTSVRAAAALGWVLSASALLSAHAWGQSSIPVANAGFEEPDLPGAGQFESEAPGWSNFGPADEIGVLHTQVPDDYDEPPPDGKQVGYVFGDVPNAGFSQVLTSSLFAEGSYTLTVEVGNSKQFDFAGYRVQLLAGGTLLGQVDSADAGAPLPDEGEFATVTIQYGYDSDEHSALIGEPLEIRLLGKGEGGGFGDTQFDDVRLTISLLNPTADPGGPYAIPATGSLALDGSASLPSAGAAITQWEWDLANDDNFDVTGETPAAITYADLQAIHGMSVGPNTIQLRVTDSAAKTSTVEGIVTLNPPIACQLDVLDLAANSGINPATDEPWAVGDTYRLVFVTTETTQATSSDIATYNAFVRSVAAASTTFPKLGNAIWNVVGSTATVDARDNTGTNPGADGAGVPVFLMDGATTIAIDNADLWGGISDPVGFDENNEILVRDRVFTGTLGNGTRVTGTGDQPLGSTAGNIRTGRSDRDGIGWMTNFNNPATNFNSVFAMSEVLTVVDQNDTTAPQLVSIVDDVGGGPVEVPVSINYTVTFDKPMSAGSVNVAAFENASATPVTIQSVTPTADPAVYQVAVSALQVGTLRLQIRQDAEVADLPGNPLDTSSALPAEDIITLSEDLTDPTLVSISDNVGGGPVFATQNMTPRYTVTFSEPIDTSTVSADDFENGSTAPIADISVSATGNPAVFEVFVTTSGPGDLVLQIKAGAVITDLSGNALDTTTALPDDTTITVLPVPDLAGELGVIDIVNANGGINPATGLPWADGDTYRIAFITSQTITGESTDIETYNTFVQGVANAAGLGGATWKVIGSTADVAARDNTSTNPLEDGQGEPIILMDGVTILANDYDDLWNGINIFLDLDENAEPLFAERVLTGSNGDGTQAFDGRVLGGSSEDPPRVMTGNNTKTGVSWMLDFSVETTSAQPVFALSGPLMIGPPPEGLWITSFTLVGENLWELSLVGSPETNYEFRSSTDLTFDPGEPVETLVEAGPGVVTDGSWVTTDENGDATVRMTLSGHPSDFVRAQSIPDP